MKIANGVLKPPGGSWDAAAGIFICVNPSKEGKSSGAGTGSVSPPPPAPSRKRRWDETGDLGQAQAEAIRAMTMSNFGGGGGPVGQFIPPAAATPSGGGQFAPLPGQFAPSPPPNTGGGGGRYAPPSSTPHDNVPNPVKHLPPFDPNKTCDLIVLGLKPTTTSAQVGEHFKKFGALAMVELKSGRNANVAFAFVRFVDKAVERKVLKQKHTIDERDCTVRIPDSQQGDRSLRKIYVGYQSNTLAEKDLIDHFEKHGDVSEVIIPNPFRHFCFVIFMDGRVAQSLVGQEHELKGVKLSIRSAGNKPQNNRPNLPQQQQRNSDQNAYSDLFRKMDSGTQNFSSQGGGRWGAGNGAAGGGPPPSPWANNSSMTGGGGNNPSWQQGGGNGSWAGSQNYGYGGPPQQGQGGYPNSGSYHTKANWN